MLSDIGWIVQDPAVSIGHDERIPVRQVELVHVVAVRVVLYLGGEVDAEAHANRCLRARCQGLRQLNGHPLPAEIVIERASIHHNVLDGEAASQVGLDGHHNLIECHTGLVGVADGLIRAHLVSLVIEQHVYGVLCPCGCRPGCGRRQGCGSVFECWGWRIGGRERREGIGQGRRRSSGDQRLEWCGRGRRVGVGGDENQLRRIGLRVGGKRTGKRNQEEREECQSKGGLHRVFVFQ